MHGKTFLDNNSVSKSIVACLMDLVLIDQLRRDKERQDRPEINRLMNWG